ncbi:MAG: TolC family protein [Bacteroidia bacterium]|nr:TolC family protein [Bacteroidia bacterium]MCF8426727.1 TolC family protein [Bacteroidia bacterium]
MKLFLKIHSKQLLSFALFAFFFQLVSGQNLEPLKLEYCQQKAQENYPLVKQRELISQSLNYSIDNATKGYFPQFQVLGQATYQSEVTRIPIPILGNSIPSLSKDQYRIYGDLNQAIYDGGMVRNQKDLIKASSAMEEKKLAVDLHNIKERVNQLFFGVLIIEEQLVQTEIYKSDIKAGLDRVTATVKYGAALKSNQDILQAELLKTEQKTIELMAAKKSYLHMLGMFINQSLPETQKLQKPDFIVPAKEINRPELSLFQSQRDLYKAQMGLLNAKNMPKLNLFAQGGYGRPALNMLSNNFEWYYIGGLRLNWNFSGLYTLSKEKKIIGLNQKQVDVQQETFLFNTQFAIEQQNEEMEKWQKLILSDEEILKLRTSVKENSKVQLENGVIQASDYIREVNAADLAAQNKITHQIQLLMTQYNQQTTKGN